MAKRLEQKRFDEWNRVKKSIHKRARVQSIQEGEIWWFGDGENIGVEINGKGERFARPVLVLTKFGRLSFLGIPLTTKKHEGPWYAEYTFGGEIKYAVLCQAKTISIYRLYRKMGVMSSKDFKKIKRKFRRLCRKKFPQPCGRGAAGLPEYGSIIAKLIRKIKGF